MKDIAKYKLKVMRDLEILTMQDLISLEVEEESSAKTYQTMTKMRDMKRVELNGIIQSGDKKLAKEKQKEYDRFNSEVNRIFDVFQKFAHHKQSKEISYKILLEMIEKQKEIVKKNKPEKENE